jgi:para-aminobenzoate synthetase component 1
MNFLASKKIGRTEIDELPVSFPPEYVFDRIQKEPFSFFLDSGMNQHKLGRYSFMGYSPFLILKSKGKNIEIVEREKVYHETGNPFHILDKIIKNFKIDANISAPPFLGGAVGYLSYDLCHFIERLPRRTVDDLKLPDCYFCFYDTILGYDHQKKRWYFAQTDFGRKGDHSSKEIIIKRINQKECRTSYGTKKMNSSSLTPFEKTKPMTTLESNFSREDYLQAIKRAKEYIFAGDIYQVNLSQRFHAIVKVTPYQLYKKLRRINPAPFACYLDFQDLIVVSSSPERFLKVEGSKVQTRPIKGTRPRGKNEREDIKLKDELLKSEKDRAELNMIVDLERNDLGRVCDYGTVKVKEHAVLETYTTLFHLVSTVEGKLLPKYNYINLLKACFPGGSITGAPKIRSMEIIDELEPTTRSVYTGSIGYLGFNNHIDLNIAIRTIIIKGKDAYFQVGGGIVADSRPEEEYKETLDKAKALIESFSPD